jgi:hypothetical protein
MAITKTDICNLALSETGNEGNQITNFDTDTGKSARQCRLHYQQTLEELIRTHTWGCSKERTELCFSEILSYPSTLTVTGTGTSSDATYNYVQDLNDKPGYEASGGDSISWDGTEWRLLGTGEFWTNSSDTDNPPKCGWSTGDQGSPAPSISYSLNFDWTHEAELPSNCLRPLMFSATNETTIYYKFNDEWTIEGRTLLANYDQGYLLYLKEPTTVEMDSLFIRAFVVLLASKLAVPIAGDRKMKIDLINEFDQVIMPEARRVNGFEGYENPMVDSEWMEATMSSSDASSSWPPFQQSSYGTLKH